jgi:hypothetical protein
LTGTVPDEIGYLSMLTSLNLNQNQLTGTIPSSIRNLTQLQMLTFNANCTLTPRSIAWQLIESADIDVFCSRSQVLQVIQNQTQEALDLNSLSPNQLQALTWLADEDEWALDVLNVNPTFVVQRYALAAIYYATDGWPACLQFVSQLHHCDWAARDGTVCDLNDNPGVATGVTCDGNGYVIRLDPGK